MEKREPTAERLREAIDVLAVGCGLHPAYRGLRKPRRTDCACPEVYAWRKTYDLMVDGEYARTLADSLIALDGERP